MRNPYSRMTTKRLLQQERLWSEWEKTHRRISRHAELIRDELKKRARADRLIGAIK